MLLVGKFFFFFLEFDEVGLLRDLEFLVLLFKLYLEIGFFFDFVEFFIMVGLLFIVWEVENDNLVGLMFKILLLDRFFCWFCFEIDFDN